MFKFNVVENLQCFCFFYDTATLLSISMLFWLMRHFLSVIPVCPGGKVINFTLPTFRSAPLSAASVYCRCFAGLFHSHLEWGTWSLFNFVFELHWLRFYLSFSSSVSKVQTNDNNNNRRKKQHYHCCSSVHQPFSNFFCTCNWLISVQWDSIFGYNRLSLLVGHCICFLDTANPCPPWKFIHRSFVLPQFASCSVWKLQLLVSPQSY